MRSPFILGYEAGQDDLLKLLDGGDPGDFYPDEDRVFVTFGDDDNRTRYMLWCLASNLAIGGALCASFRAGDNFGFHMASEEYGQCTYQWSPNVRGEPYRGSTRCEQDSDDDADEAWQRWFDEECGHALDPLPDGREGGGR